MNWLWQIFEPANIGAFFIQFKTEMAEPACVVLPSSGAEVTVAMLERAPGSNHVAPPPG